MHAILRKFFIAKNNSKTNYFYNFYKFLDYYLKIVDNIIYKIRRIKGGFI